MILGQWWGQTAQQQKVFPLFKSLLVSPRLCFAGLSPCARRIEHWERSQSPAPRAHVFASTGNAALRTNCPRPSHPGASILCAVSCTLLLPTKTKTLVNSFNFSIDSFKKSLLKFIKSIYILSPSDKYYIKYSKFWYHTLLPIIADK